MAGPRRKDAYVSNPEIFKKLIGTIDYFIADNKDHLKKVDNWILGKENELHDIKLIIEKRLVEAENKLANCENALTLCQCRVEFDEEGNCYAPDCSSEENAVIRAGQQVNAANNALQQMMQILRYAREFSDEYAHKKGVFMQLLDNKLPFSQGILGKHDQIMQEYLSLGINGSAGSTGGSSSSSSINNTGGLTFISGTNTVLDGFNANALQNWSSIDHDSRAEVIKNLASHVANGLNIDIKNLDFEDLPENSCGYHRDGNIVLNSKYLHDPALLKEGVDTLVHEVRHRFQQLAMDDPTKYGITQKIADI